MNLRRKKLKIILMNKNKIILPLKKIMMKISKMNPNQNLNSPLKIIFISMIIINNYKIKINKIIHTIRTKNKEISIKSSLKLIIMRLKICLILFSKMMMYQFLEIYLNIQKQKEI